MSAKTANVTARIQPEIKEQAEAILSQLGIPVSVFIDMAYRQVILRDGIPFSPRAIPCARRNLTGCSKPGWNKPGAANRSRWKMRLPGCVRRFEPWKIIPFFLPHRQNGSSGRSSTTSPTNCWSLAPQMPF